MRSGRRDRAEIEKRAIYTENDSDSEAFGWFVLISILGFNGIKQMGMGSKLTFEIMSSPCMED